MKFIVVIFCCFSVLLAFGRVASVDSVQTKKVAVLDVVDKQGTICDSIKLMVRSNLAAAITTTPDYEMCDRVDVASIISNTGMVSNADIKKLKEMTGADCILVAEVAEFGENWGFITAKILNVETAKLERTSMIQTGIRAEELLQGWRQLIGNLFGIPSNDKSK